MTREELTTFLGPAAEQMDEQTLTDLLHLAHGLDEKWPGRDLTDSRIHALNGAIMAATGDDYIEGLAQAWQTAHSAAEAAREAVVGAIRWEATQGMSQSEIARRTGMTRVTVGKALRP